MWLVLGRDPLSHTGPEGVVSNRELHRVGTVTRGRSGHLLLLHPRHANAIGHKYRNPVMCCAASAGRRDLVRPEANPGAHRIYCRAVHLSAWVAAWPRRTFRAA